MVISDKPYIQLETSYETFKHKDKLSKEHYRKILSLFSILLYKIIIEKQESVRLPHGLGALYIKKFQMNPRARQVDYIHYRNTGEVKMIKRDSFNFGYYLRTTWDKRIHLSRLPMHITKYIQFKPHREAKKQINEYIKGLSSIEHYHN